MRNFYENLKKIEDFTSFDRKKLLEYIHRQKFEATAICGLGPTFWVELDYVVGLAKSVFSGITEEKKSFFINSVFPLMKEKILSIKEIEKTLPENEFFYLKKDLKAFEDIFSHASNLLDKKLYYYLPYSLFLHTVNSMTVLYPLCEKSCDLRTVARRNYDILLARYLAGDFSAQLVDIIDYLIWVQAVSSKALDSDKIVFRKQIVKRLFDFIDTESDFSNGTEYSAKSFIFELHEVLTDISIKGRIKELYSKILDSEVSVGECVRTIVSIFLDPQAVTAQANTLRDLAIASDLASSVIKHINEGNNRGLYEDIALSKALKPYFMQVSRHMFGISEGVEIARLFEIMFYLEETAPSFIMHEDIVTQLENSVEKFESHKVAISKNIDKTLDPEVAELFKAKMKQVYAGKL